jgi:hypothetical protein
MATVEMSISEVRRRLLELADRLEREPSTAVDVKKHGRRVMMLLSAALRSVDAGKSIQWSAVRDEFLE